MFDDLKIRSKLILLMTGPLVIIVLLAALGARSRLDAAADSRTVESLVAMAQANADVVDALQQESLYSAAYVGADREAWAAQTKAARKHTDAVMAQAVARLESAKGNSSPGFQVKLTKAIEAGDKLVDTRKTVDQGYTFDQVASAYAELGDVFLGTNAAVTESIADPKVSAELRTAGALAAYKGALARQGSLLVGAAEQGSFTAKGSYDLLARAVGDANSQYSIFSTIASSGWKDAFRDARTSDALVSFETVRDQAVDGGFEGKVDTDPKELTAAASAVLADLHEVETSLYQKVIETTQAARSTAEKAANLFLVGAGLAIIATAAAAVFLGRMITKPLNELADAADHLAQDQMPKLVESLRNPAEDEVSFQLGAIQEIDIHSNDEIGRLAASFNDVQRVASEVAAEQAALLRKGIGEMFVNLARRNQALLDRQIEFIDELEQKEEDPDSLENLYRLDHLATRMRRNAESLLVLAGAEPPRRRGRPAPLANVVRAALAEVEDFGRIELLSFDEVLVASNTAADLAHLLSELMENAANFSPPETRVEVVGHRTKADGYVISVTDHGIGMSAEQIAEANESLATPPLVGLALSRSLGFIVVGRLAARHGIAVRMMPSPSGGVTAVVSLPPTLITDSPGLASGRPPQGDNPTRLKAVPAGSAPAPAAPSAPAASSNGSGDGTAGPLSFAPIEFKPPATDEAPAPAPREPVGELPTGPVRADHGAPSVNGLPTRRFQASPGVPRGATVSPISSAPSAAPADDPAPAPTAALVFADPGAPEEVPSPVAEAPVAAPNPPVPAAPEVALPGTAPDEDLAGTLDGPPPAAPPMPSRTAPPRRSDAPAAVGNEKPFFLEESAPPRLFGSGAKAAAAEEDEPAAPSVAPLSASPNGAPLGRREPAAPAPVEPPAPAPSVEPVAVPAAPNGSSGSNGSNGSNGSSEPTRTASGLAKRTPRQAGATRAIPGSDGERGASASKRSPEEVRNLLSRYRAGQERARTEEPVPAGAPHERDTP